MQITPFYASKIHGNGRILSQNSCEKKLFSIQNGIHLSSSNYILPHISTNKIEYP